MRLAFLAFFAFVIFGFLPPAAAQVAQYSVECPKPDSCFLKEVTTAAATAQEPRPQTVTAWRLFRSQQEFDMIVASVRKQAADELSKGMEIVDRARALSAIADKIEAARPAQKKQ